MERRLKISPGHREKYNHAALHNAATRVGAINIADLLRLAVSGTLQCM